MKLSDIKGERLLTTIADCITPITNILEDDDIREIFTKRAVPEGEDENSFTLKRIVKALPSLFGKHAHDMTIILGTIASNTPEGVCEGMTVEKYRECGNYLKDAGEILADKDFLGFLGLA